MRQPQSMDRLDRHALVTTIWLASGLMAAALLHHGYRTDGALFVLAGFGAVATGFIGHVIVNAVLETTFSPREVALALVVYAAALVCFGIATLAVPGFAGSGFLPTAIGFIALFVVVIFYMATALGVRRAFNSFDVIRDFGADKAEESKS